MHRRNGITLIEQVLRSKIETLDLQRNKLGFKTGAFILNELGKMNDSKKIALRNCDLQYNPMSLALRQSVGKAFATAHGDTFDATLAVSSLESTQKRRPSPAPHHEEATTPVPEEEEEQEKEET